MSRLHDDAVSFAFELPRVGALLGLDPGAKTVGVAVSDLRRSLATALETLPRGKFGAVAARLRGIAADREAVGVVIGWPLNMDGSEGPSAQSARALARSLSNALDLPALLWDERLSTAAVERHLIAADASRRRRAEVVDRMAAAYILQGALDRLAALRGAPGEAEAP